MKLPLLGVALEASMRDVLGVSSSIKMIWFL